MTDFMPGKRGLFESADEAEKRRRVGSAYKWGVLHVQTTYHIYGINLDRFDPVSFNWGEVEDLYFPPLASRVNLVQQGWPTGMGFFNFGSELFGVGGEMFKTRDFPDWDEDNEDNYDTVHEDHIFEIDPYKKSLHPSSTFPRMKAGKALPMVELIEGKIFVHFSTNYFLTSGAFQCPLFEFLDLSSKTWKEVGDLPYSSMKAYTICFEHFVLGTKFFIIAGPGELIAGPDELYCFDAHTMKWDGVTASTLTASFNFVGMQLPCRGRCISGLGLEDNQWALFSIPKRESPTGYEGFVYGKGLPCAYLIDNTGQLLSYQFFPDLFEDYLSRVILNVQSFFIDLGEGKLCVLLYGCEGGGRLDFVLLIAIVQFQKRHTAKPETPANCETPFQKEEEFLKATILQKNLCLLNGLGFDDFPRLVNACFL